MELFTTVEIKQSSFKIDYSKNILFVGSCFAENISKKFLDLKFNAMVNPFGILYNPISIENMFQGILQNKEYSKQDIFCESERWNCFDFHGSFSAKSKEECLGKLNAAVQNARDFLAKTDVVFITLGTAFVYFLKETGKVVSNCHKQNENIFSRQLISVEQATCALERIVDILKKLKSNIQVVFTVSPLRHLKDGAHGNNISKSTLLLAVNNVIAKHPDCASYFASYEIVIDELRDYRFYGSDMVHLSPLAESLIFEKMAASFFDKATFEHTRQVEKFMKMAEHKIIDLDSPRTHELAQKNLALAQELELKIPGLNLTKEKEYFSTLQ